MEEDLDEALDYARRSVELAPDEIKQFPLAALGWVHYKRKEFDKAIDFLSKSSELGPSSTTLTHLGMALLAHGEEDQARNVLAHARTLGEQGRGPAREDDGVHEGLDAPHRAGTSGRPGEVKRLSPTPLAPKTQDPGLKFPLC